MYDTHAHVQDRAFDDDRPAMLARAKEAGVERIITVGCSVEDSRAALAAAATFGLDAAIGVHPHEAEDAPSDLAATFDALQLESTTTPIAIGEIGLDYHYEHSPRERQRAVLTAQLRYAREKKLPVIFHQREAFDDFTRVLEAEWDASMRGVVHCFTGTADQAHVFVDSFGLRLGIGGVATFKTAEPLRQAIRSVGVAPLVLETDAPYLAPIPHRGKRNEPAFVAETAAAIATLLSIDRAEIIAATTRTARVLFGLSGNGV